MFKYLKAIRKKIYINKLRKNGNVRLPVNLTIGEFCMISSSTNEGITIGENFQLSDFAQLLSWNGSIIIGSHCSINSFSKIVSLDRITLGNNVVIASYVSILDHDHDIAFMNDPVLFRQKYKTAQIQIGNNVWIGDKVTILKGVTIGDNVVVAANSVVTKNLPSNTVAGGIPAKVLKQINM